MGRSALIACVLWAALATPSAVDAQSECEGGSTDCTWATVGWLRFDADAEGAHVWAGATHQLGAVDLASDIEVVGALARFDLGLAIAIGPGVTVPLVGLGFDFATQEVTGVHPRLFTVVEVGPIYFEQWTRLRLHSTTGYAAGDDRVELRQFVLLALARGVGLGPQAEVVLALNDAAGKGVVSAPVGGRLNVHYGAHNILGLFLGYEVVESARQRGIYASTADGIAGRFTFIRTW